MASRAKLPLLAPLGQAEAGPRRQRQPWIWRLQRWMSNYLPLGLMGLLAAATVWLARQTPLPDGPTVALPPRSTPDYEMRGFELQRFAAGGARQGLLRGQSLRHYPDSDRIEIDAITLELRAEDGSLMLAEARRAEGPQSGSELLLRGDVVVRRFAPGADPSVAAPQLRVRTESLLALRDGGELRSSSPSTIESPGALLNTQGGFRYEHASGRLQLLGRTQSTFQPPPRKASR